MADRAPTGAGRTVCAQLTPAMRSRLLIVALLISLAANALALAWLRRTGEPRPETRQTTSVTSVTAASRPLAWTELRIDHPDETVAQLRAAGISSPYLRSVLAAMLEQETIARRKELEGPAPAYWKYLVPPAPLDADPKARAALREMLGDHERLLDRLLGPGVLRFDQFTDAARNLVRYSGLPPDKARQLQLLEADYGELNSAARAAMFGISLPGDREVQGLLDREKEKDIQALLSSEEYELYLLRNSPTANTLRSNLATFSPSEEEFGRIFRLRLDFERNYDFMKDPLSADPVRSGRAEAEQRMNEAIQAALGPVRGVEYVRESDVEYRETKKVVAQLGLTAESAVPIWTLAKDYQKRVSAVTSDQGLSNPANVERLSRLLQEASTQLSEQLGGAQGLAAYKRSMGGTWMTFAEALRARMVSPPRN